MLKKILTVLCLIAYLNLDGMAAVVPDSIYLSDVNVPDSIGVINDSVAARPKKGFFHSINNYFKSSNEDKTLYKKFDWTILGGPHYSNDVKLGLGLVAAGLFRLDREDFTLPPSNVSLFGDISTSGFYLLGIRSNMFFNGGKYRLDVKTYFYSMPSRFWGIGYDSGRYNDEVKYQRDQMQVSADFMWRMFRHAYIGVSGTYNYIRGHKFDHLDYLQGQKSKYINTGAGLFLMYDSRDAVTAPHRGVFFKLENTVYPGFLGNKPNFNSMEVTLDYYHKVWKDAILAYDLHGMFNTGTVPWTMLAKLGGSSRMRGYYEGRYRDRSIMEVQAELRQRIWRRIGGVAWVGAGNVFHSLGRFDFSETLPNYGVGFRWEFKSRVNVRIDYGFGKKTSAFMFNINEAF